MNDYTMESPEGVKYLRSALRAIKGSNGRPLRFSEMSFVSFIGSRLGKSLKVSVSRAEVVTVCGGTGPFFSVFPEGFVAAVSAKDIAAVVREVEALTERENAPDDRELSLLPMLPTMPKGYENHIKMVENSYAQGELNALAQRQPIFVVHQGEVLRLQAVLDYLPRADEFKIFCEESDAPLWVERNQLLKLMFEPQGSADVLAAKTAIQEFISKPTHWACRQIVELDSVGNAAGSAFAIELAQFTQGEAVAQLVYALTTEMSSALSAGSEYSDESARQGTFLEQTELHEKLNCYFVGNVTRE